MFHRRLFSTGSLTLALVLAVSASAVADEIVLIANSTFKAPGGRVRGQIQSESPSEVEVTLGANTQKVPTSQIASISYTGQPPSMALAEPREASGLLAEAADLYKKAATEAEGKPFIVEAALFHQARDVADIALADPSRVAEGISLLDAFTRAHSKGRHIASALEALARLQLHKGDIAGVQKTIAELARQPDSAERAAVMRAKVFAKQGDHDKAIGELDKLIKGAPDGSVMQREAKLAKAESLVAQKKFTEAETDVRSVIKASPAEDVQAQSAAYNTLGECLAAAGKPKDALLAYLHTDVLYFKDKEQHPRALAQISKLWHELKQDQRGDDVWQRLKTEYPSSPYLAAARRASP